MLSVSRMENFIMVFLDTYTRDPRNARNARGQKRCVVPGEIGSLGVGEVQSLWYPLMVEKSGVSSPVEGTVVYPSIYKVISCYIPLFTRFYTSQVVVWDI